MASVTCSKIVYIWLVVCHVKYHMMTSGVPDNVGQMVVKWTSSVYWNRYNSQNVSEYSFEEVNDLIFLSFYLILNGLILFNFITKYFMLYFRLALKRTINTRIGTIVYHYPMNQMLCYWYDAIHKECIDMNQSVLFSTKMPLTLVLSIYYSLIPSLFQTTCI